MPVFRSGKGNAPSWCEMERFELVELDAGQELCLDREQEKEELIVCRGAAVLRLGNNLEAVLPENGRIDLTGPRDETPTVSGRQGGTLVCRMFGHWQSVNASGLFGACTATPPIHDTPYDYEKTTRFDNHYHDCDEYWIFYEGRARVVSEGKFYDVGPGDCVVTGMGWHHDVATVEGEGTKAVYFEGTLEGRKRTGHLWEPKHGPALPQNGRV